MECVDSDYFGPWCSHIRESIINVPVAAYGGVIDCSFGVESVGLSSKAGHDQHGVGARKALTNCHRVSVTIQI